MCTVDMARGGVLIRKKEKKSSQMYEMLKSQLQNVQGTKKFNLTMPSLQVIEYLD